MKRETLEKANNLTQKIDKVLEQIRIIDQAQRVSLIGKWDISIQLKNTGLYITEANVFKTLLKAVAENELARLKRELDELQDESEGTDTPNQ